MASDRNQGFVPAWFRSRKVETKSPSVLAAIEGAWDGQIIREDALLAALRGRIEELEKETPGE